MRKQDVVRVVSLCSLLPALGCGAGGGTYEKKDDKLAGGKVTTWTSNYFANKEKTLAGKVVIRCAMLPDKLLTLTLESYGAKTDQGYQSAGLAEVLMRWGKMGEPQTVASYVGAGIMGSEAIYSATLETQATQEFTNTITFPLTNIAANVAAYHSSLLSATQRIQKALAPLKDSLAAYEKLADSLVIVFNQLREVGEVAQALAFEQRVFSLKNPSVDIPESPWGKAEHISVTQATEALALKTKLLAEYKMGTWADDATVPPWAARNSLFLVPQLDGEWVFRYKASGGTNEIVLKRSQLKQVINDCQ